jgi:hypothetical protein
MLLLVRLALAATECHHRVLAHGTSCLAEVEASFHTRFVAADIRHMVVDR